jgi:hypothetical protein
MKRSRLSSGAALVAFIAAGCSATIRSPGDTTRPDAQAIAGHDSGAGDTMAILPDAATAPDGATHDSAAQVDTGPPVVRACGALPAPGTWERISPPDSDYTTQKDARANGFGNQTDAIAINPHDPATMYVGSNCQGIWRTDDCGASWRHVNDGENGHALDDGAPTSLLLDPTKPDVVWVINLYGSGLWKSMNGGHDWIAPMPKEIQQAFVFGFIGAMAMDPTNPDHIIVAPHGSCVDQWGPACLAETTDAGATWRLVHAGGSWNEGSGPMIVNATTWGVSTGGGISMTTDSGVTWDVVTPPGMGAYGSVHRSAAGVFYVSVVAHGMLVSLDGLHWTVPSDTPMCVPVVSTGDRIICGHQWSKLYFSANASDLTHWDPFPAPGGGPDDSGAVWLGYDPQHRLLYSSRFRGGLWRMVLE